MSVMPTGLLIVMLMCFSTVLGSLRSHPEISLNKCRIPLKYGI